MRYKGYGELDDQPLLDGDEGFAGLVSREDADQLPPGMLSYATNIRLTNKTIEPRKTILPITNEPGDIALDNDKAFDAIPYSDARGAYESIIIAGETQAYLHDGGTGTNLVDVPYPNGFSVTEGFLLKTSVSTLLFTDASPNLNFVLDGTTNLGNQVLRLQGGDNPEFKLFKQVGVNQILANYQIETTDPSIFDEGELVSLEGVTSASVYRVVSVNDHIVQLEVPDNDTNRPPWQIEVATNSIIYSIEDQCPSAKFATWAGNRLIVPAGLDDIFISSALSTHVFPEYNRLTIGSMESGNVTALEPLVDDSLIVFKENSIYLVNGIYSLRTADQGGNLAIIRISDQLGCTNQNAVQIVGQEVMFYNKQGLYSLTLNSKGEGGVGLPPQAIRITDLSLTRDIENQLDDFSLQHDSANVHFHKGKIYLLLKDETYTRRDNDLIEKSKVFVYSAILGKWESVDNYEGGLHKIFTIVSQEPKLIGFHLKYGLIQLEAEEGNHDYYNSATKEDLRTEFQTRGYRAKTFLTKLWKNLSFVMNQSNPPNPSDGVHLNYTLSTNYPFSQKTEGILSPTFDYANHKKRLNLRGDSASFYLNSKNIRYNFKRLSIDAMPATRSIQKL